MVQNAHKTCTDWAPTRLYDPVPTLALKSYPTLSPTRSTTPSSVASSTTLTPTPSTTPPQPKSFLADLSASPPSDLPSPSPSPSPSPPPSSLFSNQPPRSSPSSAPGVGGDRGGLYTVAALESLHASSNYPFTHLPCSLDSRCCPDPTSCPDPVACAGRMTTTTPTTPPALHADAILVSVHGAYSHHHAHHRPFAAAAVYFAAGSPLNRVVRLDEEYPGVGGGGGGGGDAGEGDAGGGGGAGRVDGGSSFGEVTRQRVELLAGIRALERVADVVRALEEEKARARKGMVGKKRGRGSKLGAPGSRDWYVAGVERKVGLGVGGLGHEDDDDEGDDDEEGEDDEDDDGALSQVVLKTHSKYLVRAAVEGLAKWKANGWMNSKGRVVANVDLLWYLDRRITWLEWVGVEVMLLLVGKEDNEGAIKLVGKTLD